MYIVTADSLPTLNCFCHQQHLRTPHEKRRPTAFSVELAWRPKTMVGHHLVFVVLPCLTRLLRKIADVSQFGLDHRRSVLDRRIKLTLYLVQLHQQFYPTRLAVALVVCSQPSVNTGQYSVAVNGEVKARSLCAYSKILPVTSRKLCRFFQLLASLQFNLNRF